MEEREAKECTRITSYPVGSGPRSVLEDNDHVFSKGGMGVLGDKLSRYGKSQYC